jgi:type I restriction enzyme S subunit
MPSEWRTTRLGDLADSVSVTHGFGKDMLIFLNTSDVFLGKLLHHAYSSVSEWPGQAKKSIRRNDILFSEIRPANGRWAYVDVEADDYVVSTKLMVIRARQGRILPRYLYHFNTSPNPDLVPFHRLRSTRLPNLSFR